MHQALGTALVAGQQKRFGWAGSALLLALLPSSAIAHPPPPEAIAPAPLAIEFSLSPSLPPTTFPLAGTATDYLPARPSPRATRLVLRLRLRRLYVYSGRDVLASYPVAIGAAATPTPTGEFEVFQMVVDPVWESPWTGEIHAPGANSALGLRWIGFARQPNGVIGFHGTPTVSSIGRAVSNGCVRLRNEHVVALYEYVRMGMPVVVEP